MKILQIITTYENYSGGINNRQVSRIVSGYETVKIFTSLNSNAHKRAIKFLT